MMTSKRQRAISLGQVVLVLGLLLGLVLGGCGPAATSVPTPEGDQPAPAPTDEEPLNLGPVFARDAALAYLATTYGERAPAPGLAWTEKDTSPNTLGGSSFEYRAGDWVITVQYPIVAPDSTIYAVTADDGSSFHWEGEVNPDGEVRELVLPEDGQEQPAGDEEPADIGPAFARNAALAYLAATYGEQAPAPDLAWTEKDTTPANILGSSSFEYRAGDWVITVQYPIVLPENTVYTVTVDDGSSFHWEGEVNPDGEVRELVLPRRGGQEQPAAGPAGGEALPVLVEGNSLFALDLYHALREQDGNLFFSPYSISAALAMTYAGARGQTEEQMAEALHFDLPQETLHSSFGDLSGELASRGEGAEGQDGEGFRLNVANALWLQDGFDLLPEYLALMESAYGAAPRPVDFQGAPEDARVTINDWVAGATEDRITDLIPAGVIDALTRLVLTNAIYFNAAWAVPFDQDLTSEGPFTLLDGEQISVPMMRQTEGLPYAAGEGYQAVELYYDGGELSMVVVLPEEGGFEAFDGSLDAARLAEIEAGLSHQQVALSMPRFEFDSQFSLSEALASLGMEVAFTDTADFSGMTGGPDLLISEVLHKAFVSVDEEGTEAAAATAVVMNLTSAPAGDPVQMTIDRPFVFFIRDVETGTVLFLGRVLDPTQ